jgi:hypothetical protein
MACLAARNILNGLLSEPLEASVDLKQYMGQATYLKNSQKVGDNSNGS